MTILTSMLMLKFTLRRLMGLGNPVVYDSHPFYGYRLRPNQRVTRFGGARIRINNLGLRAEQDWEEDRSERRILFLGDSVTYGGSYISNDELFSHLVLDDLPGYQSGNAGVNAWGVENIHGLIVDYGFRPASIFVTVVPEGDFYRGLTRLQGQPFWNRKPRSSLEELLQYFYYRQSYKKYTHWATGRSDDEKSRVVERAAEQLGEVDRVLQAEGCDHLIYISPTLSQALGLEQKDELVLEALRKHHLQVSYLLDNPLLSQLTRKDKEGLYYDGIHLSKAGHRLWARMISADLQRVIAQRNEACGQP